MVSVNSPISTQLFSPSESLSEALFEMCALERTALSVTSMGPFNNLLELPAPLQRNPEHCLDLPFRDRASTTCVGTGLYILVCTAHPGQFLTASTRDSFQAPFFFLPHHLSMAGREVVSEQNRNKNNNDFGIS